MLGLVINATSQCRYAPAELGGSPRMNRIGLSVSCQVWLHRLCAPKLHILQHERQAPAGIMHAAVPLPIIRRNVWAPFSFRRAIHSCFYHRICMTLLVGSCSHPVIEFIEEEKPFDFL